jgi:hypothetical protein
MAIYTFQELEEVKQAMRQSHLQWQARQAAVEAKTGPAESPSFLMASPFANTHDNAKNELQTSNGSFIQGPFKTSSQKPESAMPFNSENSTFHQIFSIIAFIIIGVIAYRYIRHIWAQ